jgi:hypothetical protein
VSAAWAAPSHAEKYGGGFAREQKATSDDTPLSTAGGPAQGGAAGILDPRQPLLWFGVIAAASVGLMAYSTAVRVGPLSASLSVGK